MKLSSSEIILIKKSWSLFRIIDSAIIGDVFYGRLFLEEPSLRKMFPASMNGQYAKLFDMITYFVSRLERRDEIAADIRQLAIRHVNYGVKERHYAVVGHALIWTLMKGLGEDWNPEMKEAWTNCYDYFSQSMIQAVSAKTE